MPSSVDTQADEGQRDDTSLGQDRYVVKKPASRAEAIKLYLKRLGLDSANMTPPVKPQPAAAKSWAFPEEFTRQAIEQVQRLAAMLQEPIGIHVMPSGNLGLLSASETYDGAAYILDPAQLRQARVDTDPAKAKQFLEAFASIFLQSFYLGFEAKRANAQSEPSIPITLFVRTPMEVKHWPTEDFFSRNRVSLHAQSKALFEDRLAGAVSIPFAGSRI